MKPLLALLCAVAIGYVAYQWVYPPFGAYFGIDKPPAPPPAAVKVDQPMVVVNMPKIEEPKPEAPRPEPKPEPKPDMAVVAPPPPPPKPKDDFVPPVIPSVEEVTKNWTVLPKSMFPRQIKLAKEVEVKGVVGATKLAAGGAAFAIEQAGSDLVIAPSIESKFRGKIGITDTNIKEIVTDVYARYTATTIAAARKAYDDAKEAAKNPKKALAAKGPLRDDKPIQEKDGTYPILVDSIKNSEVTELKMDNIKKWGDVKRETAGGQDMWVVMVTFEATTPFGKFEQEAKALVKNQRVTKWIYAGSGEVIP